MYKICEKSLHRNAIGIDKTTNENNSNFRIMIPKDLHDKFKKTCQADGKYMRSVYIELIQEYVDAMEVLNA